MNNQSLQITFKKIHKHVAIVSTLTHRSVIKILRSKIIYNKYPILGWQGIIMLKCVSLKNTELARPNTTYNLDGYMCTVMLEE